MKRIKQQTKPKPKTKPMSINPNHQDPKVLEELYCEKEMNMYEIADKLEVSQATISNWIKKHNIKKKKEYHKAEVLEELYHEQEMSMREIGDKFEVDRKTIQYWMNKHNIPARKPPSEKPPYYGKDYQGYKEWKHNGGKKQQHVRVHRLLAVSEFGFDAVKDMDVHHKNGCKFDNRPENIELLNRSEHVKLHRKKQ